MSRQEKSLEAKTQLLEISGKLRVFHANLQTEVAKLGLKKKLTDLDFADAFGFSVNQIQKWESGETEIPAR